MKLHDRKKRESGSALLVVLGFLSFMVVSAVAFAIYMRAERVPSSALRRNAATRHLVKAAMAHAMSRVDDAIRNDPFPGLVNTNNGNSAECYHDQDNNPMDMWYGRVFMPPDPAGTTRWTENCKEGISPTQFAPITETVSVLNLEALGYLPPPRVNDVRFLSRSTWTAKWQNFTFDAGRFAFCAVNVSDYFDINRASAGVRTSDPESRISLAYLFREVSQRTIPSNLWFDKEEKLDSIDASAVATFMANFGPNATWPTLSTVPYVSMLDYNLALGKKFGENGIGGLIRPYFWQWISEPQRYFYRTGAGRNDKDIKEVARQPFIADSWNVDIASTPLPTNVFLHGTQVSQPFRAETSIWKKKHNEVTMTKVMESMNQDWNGGKIEPPFELCDWITLFDYLDGNDYPMSLAFPCVERVPMVAALQPALTVKLEMEAQAPRTEAGANPKERYQVTDYKLKDDILSGTLATLIAFPFRRGKDFPKGGYSAQAFVRMVLAPAGVVNLRSRAGGMKQLRPTAEEWDDDDLPVFPKEDGRLSGAFVITARSSEQNFQLPDVKGADRELIMESMVRNDVTFDFPRRAADGIVFRSRVKQENKGTESENWVDSGDPPEFQVPVLPFAADGNLQGWDRAAWISKADFDAQYASQEFVPYVFAWVRIMKGEHAVDYVPAHTDDDERMLGVATSSDDIAAEILGRIDDYPFLRWRVEGKKFTYSATPTSYSCDPGDWLPKTYFTVDPRFNWAPEDWISSDKSISKDNWLDFVDSALGKNGRDSDPFLFVSNQGYLQSIGELAFLPRLSDLRGGAMRGVHKDKVAYDGRPRAAVEDIANAACVWTGYLPYDMAGKGSDRLFRLGVVDGEGSVAVNPYTDDASIRLAAFANTPYDWWAAGTNSTSGTVGSDSESKYFSLKSYVKDNNMSTGLKYAFTDSKSDVKLEREDVEIIASAVCESIRAQPGRSWENVYDSLDWYGLNSANDKDFLGRTLKNPLYGDDRKFLYAYWRGCLANKQQLFLIFVRAESTALGGPGEGTPAQQGGRAVALVWREPNAWNDGSNPNSTYTDNISQTDIRNQEFRVGRRPHRMRVLFYHQFD